MRLRNHFSLLVHPDYSVNAVHVNKDDCYGTTGQFVNSKSQVKRNHPGGIPMQLSRYMNRKKELPPETQKATKVTEKEKSEFLWQRAPGLVGYGAEALLENCKNHISAIRRAFLNQ